MGLWIWYIPKKLEYRRSKRAELRYVFQSSPTVPNKFSFMHWWFHGLGYHDLHPHLCVQPLTPSTPPIPALIPCLLDASPFDENRLPWANNWVHDSMYPTNCFALSCIMKYWNPISGRHLFAIFFPLPSHHLSGFYMASNPYSLSINFASPFIKAIVDNIGQFLPWIMQYIGEDILP